MIALTKLGGSWLRGLAACVLVASASPAIADAKLDAARERWRTAAPADYEYGYHKYCDCHRESPPETVVTVRSDEVIGVRHRPQNSTVETPAEARNLQFYWTVNGLFSLLDSAFERGVTVRAQYDATLGYPTEIYIDYDAQFIGDEVDLRITRVTPLP